MDQSGVSAPLRNLAQEFKSREPEENREHRFVLAAEQTFGMLSYSTILLRKRGGEDEKENRGPLVEENSSGLEKVFHLKRQYFNPN